MGSAVKIPEPTPGADGTLMEGSRTRTAIKVQSTKSNRGILHLVSVPSMIQRSANRMGYPRLMHLGLSLDAETVIIGHRSNSEV